MQNVHVDSSALLNERSLRSGEGKSFHRLMVQRIRRTHGLKTRYDRLRDAGMLTLDEIAERLNVTTTTVKTWRRAGLLPSHRYSDKCQCLYEPPADDAPVKHRRKGIYANGKLLSNRTEEVQCEA